jgi:8-oxo-dGTP pyrophosphatase MutT (NUDIX family)
MTYVLGFIFDEDMKNVLLIKRSPNHPRQANLFNGIGGKVEETDCCEKSAMIRESIEEIGFTPDDWEKIIVLHGVGYSIYTYRATADLSLAKQMEEDEIHIVSLDNIPNDCVEDVDWLLRMSKSPDIIFNSGIYIFRKT